jgi:hypothetical protein
MKLFIIGTRSQNDSIVETYTFIFQTIDKYVPSVRLAETNETFCVHHLQRSFKKGINALLRSIRDLPPLPRHGRRLGVSLLYRQSCPAPYQPNGFTASTCNQAMPWENEEDTLQATRFDTGTISISISVQRHEGVSDKDQRLGIYLDALQHTSSRDPNLPPTLDQTLSSSKRKRSVTIYGQTRHPSSHRSAADVGKSPIGAVEEGLEITEETVKRHKISDSRALVKFSSQSSHCSLLSDIDSEAFQQG